MKELIAFLKNHLVLVLCIAVAVMAIGAGIWFMVSPQQPDPTETTGVFNENLDTDMGFSDIGSGIVNIPGGDSASGEVTPIQPGTNNQTGSSESETTGTQENTSGNTGSGNTNSGSQNNPQTGTVEVSGSVVENPF